MECTGYGILIETAKQYDAAVLYNEPMKGYTSFKIGGPCDVMIKINSEELLVKLLMLCKENCIKHYIIGRGSNLLISDKGLRGAVLLVSSDYSDIKINDGLITCLAGTPLISVCKAALENGLTGLEFAYGIPGSMGGAVYMNAGAFGGEMKDVTVSCRYTDGDGTIKELYADELDFSYRHSAFTGSDKCITSVTLKLEKGDKEKIKARMDELMSRRLEKQPLEYPSAGSTFKRPLNDFAARLIEASGLKGFSCGDACVSEKHSGFVVNKGNACFDDVINVVNGVKEKVKQDSGVMLECEMLIIE